MKNDYETQEKNKIIRELSQKIANLKNDHESNESLTLKRDNQVSNLIQKIKNQDHEISRYKLELSKKSTTMNTLQGELVELRPSKEALQLVDKYSKQVEELKKQLHSKDSEILMMKGMIKAWQNQYVNHFDRSPKRFPQVNAPKSGMMPKKNAMTSSNSTSKSVRYHEHNRNDYEFDESFNILENILEISDDRKHFDKQRSEIEREKIKEKEELRIKEEIEKEKLERQTMEHEEKIKRAYDENFLKELEKKKKEENEKKKKIEEESKKGKGKIQGKPIAKVGAKKK